MLTFKDISAPHRLAPRHRTAKAAPGALRRTRTVPPVFPAKRRVNQRDALRTDATGALRRISAEKRSCHALWRYFRQAVHGEKQSIQIGRAHV